MLIQGEDNKKLRRTTTLFLSRHTGSGFPFIQRVTQARGHDKKGDWKGVYSLYTLQQTCKIMGKNAQTTIKEFVNI